mmetsp:Transcript_12471/g.23147  ORF Transcript_12471/g.23147 Transcript_12471/m.23147 type:complete len:88 (+) Transcript_12471:38-301(+)
MNLCGALKASLDGGRQIGLVSPSGKSPPTWREDKTRQNKTRQNKSSREKRREEKLSPSTTRKRGTLNPRSPAKAICEFRRRCGGRDV